MENISDYYFLSIAFGIIGIIACYIPEPIISKAVGIVSGVLSLSSMLASSLIDKYKNKKSIRIYNLKWSVTY